MDRKKEGLRTKERGKEKMIIATGSSNGLALSSAFSKLYEATFVAFILYYSCVPSLIPGPLGSLHAWPVTRRAFCAI